METAPAAKRSRTSQADEEEEEARFLYIKGDPADGRLTASLAKARADGVLCDAEVECSTAVGGENGTGTTRTSSGKSRKKKEGSGSGNGGCHAAHRVVLASRSDYMKALLATDRFSDSSDKTIRLPYISYDTMGHVLQWMYGESFWLASLQGVADLVDAASRLQCVELISDLHEALVGMATSDNCLALLMLAERADFHDVAAEARAAAVACYRDLIDTNEFISLLPSTLMELAKHDHLNVFSEDVVFFSIIHWANSQDDDEVVAESIADLMACVRFPFVNKSFYQQKVATEPLLAAHPGCFRAIAESQVGCMGCGTIVCQERCRQPPWAALKKGMAVKVIDDGDQLKRLCKDEAHIFNIDWKGGQQKIAGKRFVVLQLCDPNRTYLTLKYVLLDEGNWKVPLEAIEYSDGTEERYLRENYPDSDDEGDTDNAHVHVDSESDSDSD